MPDAVVVSDTTAYLPADLVDRLGIYAGAPLRELRLGAHRARVRHRSTTTRSSTSCAAAERLPTTSQPSVGDFASAYEPLLAERPRRGLDSHLREALGHRGIRAAGRRAAGARGQGRGAGPGDRLRERRPAAWACSCSCRAAAAKAGLDLDAIEARVAEARDDLQDLVRAGHAGVPQAWWTHRRRQRLDRIHAAREADPHDGRAASCSRWNACAPARAPSSGWWTTPASATSPARTAWVVQHISAPDQAAELTDRCREVFGCDPLFIGEIGPVLSAHTARGCWAWGPSPPVIWTDRRRGHNAPRWPSPG